MDEDRPLVERCLEDDEGAFADLFRRHEARAVRLAYALVGDRATAEDVHAHRRDRGALGDDRAVERYARSVGAWATTQAGAEGLPGAHILHRAHRYCGTGCGWVMLRRWAL